MEYLSEVKQVSLLVGIWVAIYSIDSWRREHKGKREIELVEDSLALFYEAIDAIKQIRHPASYSSETESVKRGENELEKNYQARKDASVVYHRYNQHQELFNKLHASRYKFMSQIGKEEAKPFDDLRAVTNEIFLSARMLSKLWARDHYRTDEQWKKHLSQVETHEAIFWECAEEDLINLKLNKIITDIEATCKATISGKGTIYSFLNKRLGK